jgi:hypothetical protein
MNERDQATSKLERSRFRFSVAGLLCLTTILAIHLAFPWLIIALVATTCVAIALAMLMYPALTADRVVAENKDAFVNMGRKTYFVLVGLTYLAITLFLVFSRNN